MVTDLQCFFLVGKKKKKKQTEVYNRKANGKKKTVSILEHKNHKGVHYAKNNTTHWFITMMDAIILI